jgi:hypothetical protein
MTLWMVWVLVAIEVVALGMALRLVPSSNHADTAALIVAINSILLLAAVKRLRKKKDCCS